jgi:hypothetical protein
MSVFAKFYCGGINFPDFFLDKINFVVCVGGYLMIPS